MRPTGLDDLARAIADRTPIRWEELTADPAGPPPHLLSCARVVQQIAEVHAESAQTSIESSVEHGFERDTSAWAQPHRAPGPDNSWGSLRVGEKIGHGTFGDVYRAYDPHLDRPVALKLLRRRDKGEGAVVDEARLMARVRHPNVVTVFGADRVDGRVGIWMEYIEGRTVAADLAERGPFGVEEVVSIGVALCEALAAVHGAGLVHRDVKAQNILRNESGRIVLGDFGTGHDTGAGPSGAAALAGTPAYLAPEILQGQPATPRSDLYGLGVLLFHLLTGSFPVGGTSYPALREAHQTGQRTPLRQRAPHVPADLAVVIETALAADPSQRFADAATMRSALGRSRSPARSRGLTKAAALAATLALVVSVLVVAAWQLTHRRFPSVSFGSRDSLLVAEFDNRTGESLLDDTPAVVMKRELANSRSINVVPHWRVSEALTLMRKPVDTRPGTALAREIALRDGQVRVVLGGSIGRLGDHYVLDADLVNVRDGHVIASLSEGPLKPADLLAGIRRLAHAVRLHLGDVPPQTEVAAVLPKVTTSSLRALQLYGHAARLERDEGAWGEHTPAAERLLQQAVREDPEFASAYIGLSIAARLQGRMAEARAHIERAVAFSERASETERLVAAAERDGVLGAMAVTVDERLRLKRLAAAGYAAVLEIQPDHHQAAVCLTNIHWSYLRVPNVQVATRLANQRPRSARWQLAAATFLLWSNPRDRALARPYIDRAASLSLLDPFNAYSVVAARVYGIYDAWLEMNPREAMRRADDLAAELATLPLPARHILAGQLSRAYSTLGALDRAQEMAMHLALPTSRAFHGLRLAEQREDMHTLRLLHEANHEVMLAGEVDGIETRSRGEGIGGLVDAGLLDTARAAIQVLRSKDVTPLVLLLEGELALAEGNARAASQHLQAYLERASSMENPGWMRASVKFADALRQTGQSDRAIEVLEAASDRRFDLVAGAPAHGYAWLPLRERLAGLYRQAGRPADAERVERELLVLLEVADDDHPIKRRLAAARTPRG